MSTPLQDVISDNRRMVEELNKICMMPQKLDELKLTLRNQEGFLVHLTNTRDAAKVKQNAQRDYAQFLLANSKLLESYLKKEFPRLLKGNNSVHPMNWTIPAPQLPPVIMEKLSKQYKVNSETFLPEKKTSGALNSVVRCFKLYYNKQHFKLKGALKRNEYLLTELENHIQLKSELEAERNILCETVHALELTITDVQSEIECIRQNEFVLDELVDYRKAAKAYFVNEYMLLQNLESADSIFSRMRLNYDTCSSTNELECTPQSSFIIHYPAKQYSRPTSESKILPLHVSSIPTSAALEPSSAYSTDDGTLNGPATLESLNHIAIPTKPMPALSSVFSPVEF